MTIRRTLQIAVSVVILAAIPISGFAIEYNSGFSMSFTASSDGRTFTARGLIVPQSADTFRSFLRTQGRLGQPWTVTMMLQSNGGSVSSAVEIGRIARQHQISVLIDGDCLSACAFMMMGGINRTMVSPGRIGVHQFYRSEAMQDPSKPQFTAADLMAQQRQFGLLQTYVSDMGVDPAVLGLAMTTLPTDMRFLTDEELRGFRMLQSTSVLPIAAAPVSLPPPTPRTPPSTLVQPFGAEPKIPEPSRRVSALRFGDYPARQTQVGQYAPLNLSSEGAVNYRTRLREAYRGRVNFGGHYIVSTWGCGTSCETGAVIDTLNGRVTFFPHTICCSSGRDQNFKRVEFRRNSTLIVFAGLRNEEEPMGAHFYAFDVNGFRYLETVRVTGDF